MSEKMPLEWSKTLYARFATIYGEKFVNPSFHTPEYIPMWWEEWGIGLAGIESSSIKSALDYCRINVEWPPSIAEFRRYCEKYSGLPDVRECLQQAVRGEFTHALAYLTYNKVGSWATKNDKDEILQKKYSDAYKDALAEYRQYPSKANEMLEEHKSIPKLIETESRPTTGEMRGFKQRLSEWQEKSKIDRESQQPMGHPIWDKKKVCKQTVQFDEREYNERKRYLLGLNEIEAGTLDREDWYDRTRYFREIESQNHLAKMGYTGQQYEEPKKRPSGRGYVKNWMDD